MGVLLNGFLALVVFVVGNLVTFFLNRSTKKLQSVHKSLILLGCSSGVFS